jgi:IS5 family transposase
MQPGFFDLDDRLALLEKLGDPLPKLDRVVNWNGFRPALRKLRKKADPGKGGRPPYDDVLMLKILVLQQLYNLSDDQTEFQIRDRYSFCRFLGLSPEGRVPDAKTIWLFRERIRQAGQMDSLFNRLLSQIDAAGYQANQGQIVDASMVEVPRQRNTPEENQQIKAGEEPDWPEPKARQKDTQARWSYKYGRKYFGYKNHISVDARCKVIRRYTVSDGSSHDGRFFEDVLDEGNGDKTVWADAAYRSRDRETRLASAGYRSRIQRQNQAHLKLTAAQKASNRRWAKVRIRVEHVFAAQEQMGGRMIRSIGLDRARLQIGLKNFAYNLKRYAWLTGNVAPTPT